MNESKHVVCIAGKRNVDKLSDKLADKLSDKLADKLSDKLADKLSDKLSDKLADKLADNKCLNNPKKHQRSRTMKWSIDDAFFNYDKQMEVLRRLIADEKILHKRNKC